MLTLVGNLYPVPDYPSNLLPYGFLVYMLAGAAWFFVLKARRPMVLSAMSTDLEIAAAEETAPMSDELPSGAPLNVT